MVKKSAYFICALIFLVIIEVVLMKNITIAGEMGILDENTIISDGYREQNIGENMLEFICSQDNPGEFVGTYLLETKYGYQTWEHDFSTTIFQKLEQKWSKKKNWMKYKKTTQAIWDEVTYFPVPEFINNKKLTVSYVDTWMKERTYGGKRGHEGTDIIANINERGLYPILSMTDGVVEKKGWLEKGGYRIGIKSPGGVYYYYAHLDSYANLSEGDSVKAGDILGYMGDSGYGKEGTVGEFAVHLHLGIYIYPNGEELSVNPYWILRYIEKNKVKCYTEI